ncbi:MAG: hypothetical protein HLUCCA11_03945 [Phormidesmis priestleyi Ana]|uniref:Uncharacterized protein n=1 Tax=Phormidesmis priestleyi Ana TaxID=1666911 RepID=A0A0N8KNP1_9CYAN|nr:MAG: hypothetical protein HLUCCA11_03945 [Phormidesmis priestleyi Ana]
MDASSLQRMRIYLHLIPIFGIVPSIWTLYGQRADQIEEVEEARLKSASRLSVLLGLSCICAIALLGASSSTQTSEVTSLRFLISASFVGSGYFLLNVGLMFRVAKGQSIRLPGVSQFSRRLP